MAEDKLLKVENLTVHYETPDGVVEAINDVSFELGRGESLGLVGETGAGKTSIALVEGCCLWGCTESDMT